MAVYFLCLKTIVLLLDLSKCIMPLCFLLVLSGDFVLENVVFASGNES